MLNDAIIYKYNDMSSLFLRGAELRTGNHLFPLFDKYEFVNNIDPINGLINLIFFKLWEPFTAANLLAVFYTVLALIYSYKLFSALSGEKDFQGKKALIIIFSLLNTFSIYFLYRIISFTPNLYSVFVFPLGLYLYFAKKWSPFKLSILVMLTFALSSYYGFFLVILLNLLYISEWAIEVFKTKAIKNNTLSLFKNLFLLSGLSLLFLIIMFSTSIKQNAKPVTENISDEDISYRPIESYYDLSFRPWYFFIPPKESVYFGQLSRNIYQRIEDTDYYLANDYTEEEAAGSYFGWHILIGGLFVGLVLIKIYFSKSKKQALVNTFPHIYANNKIIVQAFLVIIGILFISQPPSFTISGITIYTPSYILYMVAPVFRSLVRFSVVINLLMLVINFFLYVDLINLLGEDHKKSKVYNIVVLSSFVVLSYFLLAINIPTIRKRDLPPEFKYLESKYLASLNQKTIAVYPKGNYRTIFWAQVHGHKLLNPADYIDYDTGFSSNKLSKNLNTLEGLTFARENNTDVIIYYIRDSEDAKMQNQNIEFFKENFGPITYQSKDTVMFEKKAQYDNR